VGPVWEDADGEEIVNETFTRLEKAFHAIFSERDAVASNLLRASVTSVERNSRIGTRPIDVIKVSARGDRFTARLQASPSDIGRTVLGAEAASRFATHDKTS